MLDAEVDRRFELDILDRLRAKRLQPLAKKTEQVVEAGGGDEGMSDDDLAMLQALDQQSGEQAA
jgi:hypothetical protein